MATVHLGRLLGAAGFSRTVAIKRLHPQFAKDPEFVAMFTDEARLAGRIHHPNVVGTVDVVAIDRELLLVMEYVQGESLARLVRACHNAGSVIPPAIVSSILCGVLQGLHAAHEAKTERGEPLGIVHRDVSPQNIIVGADGIARVVDFGVAKAAWRVQTSREGSIKGKISYMSPEQLLGHEVDRRTDIFVVSTVLWEALTGRRLFECDAPGEVLYRLLYSEIEAPASIVPSLSKVVDELVMRGLSREPEKRFSTAREMAAALEKALPPASVGEVAEWLATIAHEVLAERSKRVAEIESSSLVVVRPASLPAAAEVKTRGRAATLETLVAESPVMHPGRRRIGGLVALAVLLGLLGLLGIVEWRRAARVPDATAASLLAPAPSATTSPPPIVEPAESSAPSAATTTTTTTATGPSGRGGAVPSSAAAPAATGHPKIAGGSGAGASPRKARSCNPPYVIDAQGFHVPKPECL